MSLPPDAHSTYLAFDPPEDEGRALKHELVRETKRAIEEIALLDVGHADLADVRRTVEAMRAVADAVAAQPSLRTVGGLASAGPEDAALMERSGISGRSNPLAPPLHLELGDDGVTRGHAVYSYAYEGPNHCLHGGFVAAAFDDLMGIAQTASGIAGYTGTLTIRMILPTPLGRRIDYESAVDRVEGRKIWCWAKSWDGDRQLAEATIVFIAPRDGSVLDDGAGSRPR